MKSIKEKFTVPLFGADVWILVDPDIRKARRTLDKHFGKTEVENDHCYAWCEYQPGRFALCFSSDSIGLGVVAHEIFHATRRICKWASVHDEETGALLHEFLVKKIFKILRARGWNR